MLISLVPVYRCFHLIRVGTVKLSRLLESGKGGVEHMIDI